MYLYIYDSSLQDKKYAKLLSKIEARLTDLDIKGKIVRLSLLRNIGETIKDALRQGVHTIIAVGTDKTLTQIVNSLQDFSVTLGFIPMTTDSALARILGIPPYELACEVIANRLLQTIDLGKINNTYFLLNVSVEQGEVVVSSNDKYTVAATTPQQTVRIANLGYGSGGSVYDPQDGKLEAVFEERGGSSFGPFNRFFGQKEVRPSIIPMRKIKLTHTDESLPIVVDGQQVVKTPATIEVMPKQLKVIVGKERLF
ncbi:MAG: diacylglycerol kinase family protein [bacterium]|nr:diacylglycerol kinase family protein [bacterium]